MFAITPSPASPDVRRGLPLLRQAGDAARSLHFACSPPERQATARIARFPFAAFRASSAHAFFRL